jgi:signal transduction histidine kinase
MLRILESSLRLLVADAGEVFVQTAAGFEPIAWSGLSQRPTYTIALGSGITGRAAAERRSVAVDDYARDAPASAGPAARATAARDALRSIAAVPLLDGDEVLGVLNLARRDVRPFTAEELQIAEALADQAAVALRIAALVQAERSASEAARAATRAKSEFLAGMSHELRTPLNAVLGFSQLLVEQLGATLTPQQQRYFRNISDAGEHLLELINEVLDLAKVEAGRIEVRPEVIDLAVLVESIVSSTREAARERGVTFDAPSAERVTIRVDASRVRQILYNLLSNAVKFTLPGGRVELRAGVDGRDLEISVTDTGIGIPREKHDRVFGTFERLHEGRLEAAGTGLGLALTKRLVELHGGRIGFTSTEGEGTRFHVRLPGVLVESVRGERLLVVEDAPGDAELIAASASASGLRSEIVATAAAARDAILRDPPTAVVLDLRLPDARGEELLEWIKTQDRTRRIPVVVVTVEDDEGRSRALGAEDHLTKPIDRERLGAWLERIAATVTS